MNPITFFTLSGPIIGILGWYLDMPWLFWIGAGLAGLNLFMNLASGAMRFPLLPGIAIVIGAVAANGWFIGAAKGLVIYTAIEGLTELRPNSRGQG